MSDFLVELGQNPNARRIIKTLGLPIPMPEKLRRAKGAWAERPLADRRVVVGGRGDLADVIATTLAAAGANPYVVSAGDDDAALAPFRAPGEAFGRPARLLTLPAGDEAGAANGDTRKSGRNGAAKANGHAATAPSTDTAMKPDALVFDATAIDDPAGLRALYDFFHPLVGRLVRSGRVVVLGRATDGLAPAHAAAQQALEGFVRSVAKEVGRVGATAGLVVVERGAEARVGPVLRFLLSPRSAFVTAQPIRVSAQVKDEAVATRTSEVRGLEGKVALVTGAARGIGAATARLLAAEGAHVVCLDRPDDDGPTSQLAREIGGSTLFVDVMDGEAPARIASHLADRFGGVDIVVHNAGVTRDKTLARMSERHWEQALEINLGAVVRITSALLARQVGGLRDGGRIVCLSSVAGIAGNVGQANYSASKAGIVGYVRALAPQLAARGIAVNAIAPGFIETRLTAAIPVAIREAGRRLSALGQGGLPEDVGQAIAFLASAGSSGITGQVLRVCGGALIGA